MVLGFRFIVFFQIAVTRLVAQSAYSVKPSKLSKNRDGNYNSATSASRTHVFMEAATELMPHHLITKEGRASSTQMHDVMFVVKLRNMDKLVEILDNISDIKSPNYGNYMTSEEIADLTSNRKSRREVVKYLEMAGASVVGESPHGEYITASAPVSIWEHMLDTEFYTYSIRGETVTNYIRAERYSVPIDLHSHIDSAFNTIQKPMHAQLGPAPSAGISKFNPLLFVIPSKSSPAQPYTGIRRFMDQELLNKVYNIDSNVGHPRATQAVLGGPSQYFSPEDLKRFQRLNDLPRQPINKTMGGRVATIESCENNYAACAYSNMDVQIMTAMSTSPTIHYHTDLGMSAWLLEVADAGDPPSVISITFTSDESDVSASEFDAFNTQAIKLSVMGVTILVAAGDDGVNSWRARDDSSKCGYSPQFPASSPYVLSVGATQVHYYSPELYSRCLNFCNTSDHCQPSPADFYSNCLPYRAWSYSQMKWSVRAIKEDR